MRANRTAIPQTWRVGASQLRPADQELQPAASPWARFASPDALFRLSLSKGEGIEVYRGPERKPTFHWSSETRLVDATTNEIEITRCVLIDFGTSCRLNERMRATTFVSDTGLVLGAHWGNAFHIAPELQSALGSAQQARRRQEVELDYSRQSVFELGALGFEIVNGCHPVAGYPFSVTSPSGRVRYGDGDIGQISADRLGLEQASMLRRAVSCDASHRPSLDELIECFDPTGELGVVNIV